jgi:hypothetical protein
MWGGFWWHLYALCYGGFFLSLYLVFIAGIVGSVVGFVLKDYVKYTIIALKYGTIVGVPLVLVFAFILSLLINPLRKYTVASLFCGRPGGEEWNSILHDIGAFT